MKILFVAAEAAPFVKVGGLGDVIGSLPKALQDEDVEARVILPLYSSIDREKYNLEYRQHIFINLGWRTVYCGIFETEIVNNILIEIVFMVKVMMGRDLHSSQKPLWRYYHILNINQMYLMLMIGILLYL